MQKLRFSPSKFTINQLLASSKVLSPNTTFKNEARLTNDNLPEVNPSSDIKQPNFAKFRVNYQFVQKNRKCFSPNASPRAEKKPEKIDSALNAKYKEINLRTLETELKLHRIHNEIKDLETSDQDSPMRKASLCLEMIDSIFTNNKETTQVIKEILPILRKLIFCPANAQDQLQKYLGDVKMHQDDKTFEAFFGAISKHLAESHHSKLKPKAASFEEKNELNEKISHLNQEKEALNASIGKLEEKIKSLEQFQTYYDKTQKEKMELSINRFTRENALLKEEVLKTSEIHLEKKEKTLQMFSEKIRGLEQEKIQLQEDIGKLGKELIQEKTRCQNTTSNLQNLMHFVKKVKSKAKENENKIMELSNENQKLKVRAAVAWEELTPRPSFDNLKGFFESQNIQVKSKTTKEMVNEVSEILKTKFNLEKLMFDRKEMILRIKRSSSFNEKEKKRSKSRRT